MATILSTNLTFLKPFKKGKVRDVYEFEDKLLIIATDRISCFDVILPTGIPTKGKILTALSNFWFDFTKEVIDNHLILKDTEEILMLDKRLKEVREILKNRTILVKKTSVLPIECVVRNYLAGSAWKEYQAKESVCGIKLPKGLKESEKLEKPIFTPSTKAITGHDENITEEEARKIVGNKIFEEVKEKSLTLYKKANEYAETKGIIIADTKFEFGKIDHRIIIIDELLTPDSSRFWPKEGYLLGYSQPSFDKQYVRDYLETLNWNKIPPGPELPLDIVGKTKEKYLNALNMLVGSNKLFKNFP